MTGVFNEAAKVTKQVAQKVNDKVHDPDFQKQVKDVGGKIADQAKNVANTVVIQTKAVSVIYRYE